MTYHINPETGEHGKCTATKKSCPYQKQGEELGIITHFKTLKESKAAAENLKESLYGTFGTVNKSNNNITNNNDSNVSKNNDELSEKLANVHLISSRDLDLNTIKAILEQSKTDDWTNLTKICQNPHLSKESYEEIYKAVFEGGAVDPRKAKWIEKFGRLLVDNPAVDSELLKKIYSNKLVKHGYNEGITNPNMTAEILDIIQQRLENGELESYPMAEMISSDKTSDETLRKIFGKCDYQLLRLFNYRKLTLPKDLQKELDIMDDFTRKHNDQNTDSDQLHEIIHADYLKLLPNYTRENTKEVDNIVINALMHKNINDEDYELALQKAQKSEMLEIALARNLFLYVDPPATLGKNNVVISPEEQKQKKIDRTVKFLKVFPDTDMKSSITTGLLHDNHHGLSQGLTPQERYNVGYNLEVPTTAIKELTEAGLQDQRLEWILSYVAPHPNVDAETLKKLANWNGKESTQIKQLVAGNPNTSHDVLLKFSKMKNKNLLWQLAANYNINAEEQLNIVDTCLKSSGGELKNKWEDSIGETLLENSSITTKTLDKLAESDNPKFLQKIAEHPKTSMKTLLKIKVKTADENGDDE